MKNIHLLFLFFVSMVIVLEVILVILILQNSVKHSNISYNMERIADQLEIDLNY